MNRKLEVIILPLGEAAKPAADIADCVLLAYHKVNGDTVETFDKKLLRHPNKD